MCLMMVPCTCLSINMYPAVGVPFVVIEESQARTLIHIPAMHIYIIRLYQPILRVIGPAHD